MKKNISINLQGIIFHIEEDGYEVLGRYLADVKAHFSAYRGHDEIVADIESRIAEIFAARLSSTKQIISLEDVEAMTAKMGRVSDFQSADEADEDDELLAGAVASGTAQGTYTGPRSEQARATTADRPRQLFRDMANRKVAGVCAGLAQYFGVSAVWLRLIALASLFAPIIGDFVGFIPGTVALSYIVLWIVLPKRYDTPDLPDGGEKQLFRDTDTGKIGGVSAGLAAYLNTDVTLVRILFLISLFTGFGLILYIIMWIVVPEAKTVAERMRMRGDAVTLSGIASNARTYEAPSGNRRPVGMFFEDLAGALNPLLSLAGTILRVFAGLLLAFIGFVMLLTFTIALGAGIGLVPASENIVMGDSPAYVFFNGIPAWSMIAGYFAFAIPSLALLLAGVGLLLRRTLLHRTASLSLLGLWLLSIIGVSVAAARQSREFQYSAEVEQTDRYAGLTAPVLRLERREVERNHGQWVDVQLAATDSTRPVEVLRQLSAKGPSETEASRTAASSIAYTVRTRGDSALVFDDHFSYQPNARFRDQELALTVRLPRNRELRFDQETARWLGDDNFVGSRIPDNVEQHRFRLRGNELECINCAPEELDEDSDDNANEDSDSEGVNIHIDSDDEDGDVNVQLNYGGAATFNTNEEYYGSGRRRFDETDFRDVSVLGNYRVVLRRGDSFSVQAAGAERDLRDITIDRTGDELTIRPRGRTSFFGPNWRNNRDKVLITIEMPDLDKLELAGAVRADARGFDDDGRLEVQQAGASDLHLEGSFENLDLQLAGKCRTTLKGQAERLNIDGAGACEIAAADLRARTADVDLAGISKARVHATETLNADAVGASMVEYSGNPENVEKDAVGASRVSAVRD